MASGRAPTLARSSAAIGRWAEGLVLAVVLVGSLVLRTADLGTIPANITADEADNTQFALHVRVCAPPGFCEFDWKPQPMYSVWLMAQVMNVAGWTVFGMRLTSAVMSVLALIPFYLIARRQVSPLAATAATIMLATNLWYLHFSRSGWENVHVALYALGAAYCVLRALESANASQRAGFWARAGVFCALGLYGYFSGRLVVIGLLAFLPFALLGHRSEWRRVMVGYALMLLVAALLFAPQAWFIAQNQQVFANRTQAVYAFRDTVTFADAREVFVSQAILAVRGFVLFDPTLSYNSRYNPQGQGMLDLAAAGCFLLGLLISVRRWRETALWWCLLLAGIGATQVLASGTPDGARAVGFAPFFFLFAALGLETIARLPPPARAGMPVAAVCAYSAVTGLTGYFEWIAQPATLDARRPALDPADFEVWQLAQMAEARAGRRGFDLQQWTPARAAAAREGAPPGVSVAAAPPVAPAVPGARAALARRGRPLAILGASAGLADPRGVAVDTSGNVFIADGKSARVVRLAPDGTVVGSWQLDPLEGGQAEAWSLAIDASGHLLVLDSIGQAVSRYTPDGQLVGRFGQELRLYRPRGLATDAAGRIYLADTGGSRLLRLGPDGALELTIGGGPDSLVVQPTSVAVAADGAIFVSEPVEGRIQKLDANGTPLGAIAVEKMDTANAPRLAVDDRLGLLGFSNPTDGQVALYQLDLTPVGFLDGAPDGPRKLEIPSAVTTHGARVFVAEARTGQVLVYDISDVAGATARPAASPSPVPSPSPVASPSPAP